VTAGWPAWPPDPIRPLLLGDGRDAAGLGMIRRYIIWRHARHRPAPAQSGQTGKRCLSRH
jgi:hypothetical protein